MTEKYDAKTGLRIMADRNATEAHDRGDTDESRRWGYITHLLDRLDAEGKDGRGMYALVELEAQKVAVSEAYWKGREEGMSQVITAVIAVHEPVEHPGHDAFCDECGSTWPCKTVTTMLAECWVESLPKDAPNLRRMAQARKASR